MKSNKASILLVFMIQIVMFNVHAQEQANFYSFYVGDIRVIALSDGIVSTDAQKLFREEEPGQIVHLLEKSGIRNPVDIPVNAYLIVREEKRLLIDTGAGDFLDIPSAGKLTQSLRLAGYRPEDITDIYLTHVHADHSGGLTLNGQVVYPNATLHLHEKEYAYWMNSAYLSGMEGDAKEFFLKEQSILAAYGNRIETFKGSSRLLPGFRSISIPGHTPGHSAFELQSKGRKIIFWGDLVHIDAIQFVLPELDDTYDIDMEKGKMQRTKMYARMAQKAVLVAGAHLKFPGIGWVRRSEKGYEWLHFPKPHF
ncbi:MBL fold metallo-hydrolase [Dyadobacter tibetensis]|uniref:MBL fold metallo-hydrolase n=1 Tax=Dyadobacter tibetensis TaxID=1211851 RepID=UPI0018DBA627|nr:MBL fold metallo-hydrolase [Dyadobacter tibetensis]